MIKNKKYKCQKKKKKLKYCFLYLLLLIYFRKITKKKKIETDQGGSLSASTPVWKENVPKLKKYHIFFFESDLILQAKNRGYNKSSVKQNSAANQIEQKELKKEG